MTFRPMKPETVARRARERVREIAERNAASKARLQELVKRDGPDSIWAELLAEVEAR